MNKKTVLLVEDNPDDEELAMMAFNMSGIHNEVVVVRDGEEALHYLLAEGKYSDRSPSDSPKVVFLDLNIPKLNGHQVLKRLRANPLCKYIPVVILTSSSVEEDIITSYRLGANSFVRKPVDFGGFTKAIKQMVRYWLSINQAS